MRVEQIIVALNKAIEETQKSLGDGVPSTFDAYRELVGERRGLLKAVDIFNGLLRAEQEEENQR